MYGYTENWHTDRWYRDQVTPRHPVQPVVVPYVTEQQYTAGPVCVNTWQPQHQEQSGGSPLFFLIGLAIGAIWGQRSKQRKAEHIAREQQHGPTTLRQYAKDHDGGLFS
jgi:hypothetical protein